MMEVGDMGPTIRNKIIIRCGERTVKFHNYRNKFLYVNRGAYLTEYNDLDCRWLDTLIDSWS